ncbi:MAG: hypothetical protein JJU05_16830 [Verrucomicrobia bacterium]|nr:hypothetical protein [Verrucomicrobiota bacterium]MCH8528821.1 hypothetical protein [Kiritimatiellia bacterium]
MNLRSVSEEIEYVGKKGDTQSCIDGLLRYLQFDRPIQETKILTHAQRHAFLIYTTERRDTIIIRAGFGSGYSGEGSCGFAYMLSLLEEYRVETEEYEVSGRLFDRLNRAQLTNKDLEVLDSLRPVRPRRICGYIVDHHRNRRHIEDFMPIPIPLKLIDERIRDLAVSFWSDPDARLHTGFRRLEDALRSRCRNGFHSKPLFSAAFEGEKSVLYWPGIPPGEEMDRVNFFKAAYGSFRNPRAHKELDHLPEDLFSEFLTLNHLFRLESQAVEKASDTQ